MRGGLVPLLDFERLLSALDVKSRHLEETPGLPFPALLEGRGADVVLRLLVARGVEADTTGFHVSIF